MLRSKEKVFLIALPPFQLIGDECFLLLKLATAKPATNWEDA
jgi:hypothetical protein